MADTLPPLDHIIVVNESTDEAVAGDVSVFRNEDAACGHLEHWWVEDGEGFAFTAAGQRVILGVDDRDRVIVTAKENAADGQSIVRKWLEAHASAVLARRAKASKRGLFGRRPVLSDYEQRGEVPASIEGLIAYVGFDR